MAWEKQSGGSGSKLVGSYTYNANKEVVVSALDISTGIFTSVSHGLVDGDAIFPCKNLSTVELPLQVFPGGLHGGQYDTFIVVNATTDTFQVKKASTDTIAMTFTSLGVFDKWHFEKTNINSFSLTNLPKMNKAKIIMKGHSNSSVWFDVAPLGWGATQTIWMNGNTLVKVHPFQSIGSVDTYLEIILDGTNSLPSIWYKGWRATLNTSDVNQINTATIDTFYKRSKSLGDTFFNAIVFEVPSRYIANGMVVEVYEL